MTDDEVEAVFLNSDGPELEQIRDTFLLEDALRIASQKLVSEGHNVDGQRVFRVVSRIRSW